MCASTWVRPPERSTSEPAAKESTKRRDRLYRWLAIGVIRGQRLRPSYTVSPAGQRQLHRKPLAGRRRPRRGLDSSGASCETIREVMAKLTLSHIMYWSIKLFETLTMFIN